MHRKIFAAILAGILSLLMLTACGKSQFALTENTEKRMVITAERAAKDDFFLVGSLKVDDGSGKTELDEKRGRIVPVNGWNGPPSFCVGGSYQKNVSQTVRGLRHYRRDGSKVQSIRIVLRA